MKTHKKSPQPPRLPNPVFSQHEPESEVPETEVPETEFETEFETESQQEMDDRQMTASAGLIASAFKTGMVPSLKKVDQPVVKNHGVPQSQKPQNSVQREKEMIFQEEQRQRLEKQKLEREAEQKRIEEEKARQAQLRKPVGPPAPMKSKLRDQKYSAYAKFEQMF